MAQRKIATDLLLLGQKACKSGCHDNRDVIDAYQKAMCQLFSCKSWPPQFDGKFTISEALKLIKSVHVIELEGRTCSRVNAKKEPGLVKTCMSWFLRKSCPGIDQQLCRPPSYPTADVFKSFADETARVCAGLCLQCVKEEKVDLKTKCDEHTQG